MEASNRLCSIVCIPSNGRLVCVSAVKFCGVFQGMISFRHLLCFESKKHVETSGGLYSENFIYNFLLCHDLGPGAVEAIGRFFLLLFSPFFSLVFCARLPVTRDLLKHFSHKESCGLFVFDSLKQRHAVSLSSRARDPSWQSWGPDEQ